MVKRALKALVVGLEDAIDGWSNSPSPKGGEFVWKHWSKSKWFEEGEESSGAEDNVAIPVFYILQIERELRTKRQMPI